MITRTVLLFLVIGFAFMAGHDFGQYDNARAADDLFTLKTSPSTALMRVPGTEKACVIFPGILTICPDPPSITVEPGVNPDEAARRVLDAINNLMGGTIKYAPLPIETK